ncbi:MAG: hypothetical protein R3E08_09840 [Thiotrichaceae bacterium]
MPISTPGFINYELQLLNQNWELLQHYCKITDTLALARRLTFGQKNSLDALCKRYSIDNSHRDVLGHCWMHNCWLKSI